MIVIIVDFINILRESLTALAKLAVPLFHIEFSKYSPAYFVPAVSYIRRIFMTSAPEANPIKFCTKC
jgi:hypothetical protein